jgi:tRNA pseudouridine38-40 synthase
MPRYALKIEYEGSKFSGWQSQKDQLTVQGEIETALSSFEPSSPRIFGAGRTDSGVHATGQVAHVDLPKLWDPFRLMEAINFNLKPNPIAIVSASEVSSTWHARFSAINRHYLYRLVSRRAPLTHQRGLVWQVKHPLDLKKMREASLFLIGTHDFTTFRSTICQAKSPIKTIDSIEINEREVPNGLEYEFLVKAPSFLHNQIRSFVGTLERVGAGRWSPLKVKTILEKCSRSSCGPVCSPSGLYLTNVIYTENPF